MDNFGALELAILHPWINPYLVAKGGLKHLPLIHSIGSQPENRCVRHGDIDYSGPNVLPVTTHLDSCPDKAAPIATQFCRQLLFPFHLSAVRVIREERLRLGVVLSGKQQCFALPASTAQRDGSLSAFPAKQLVNSRNYEPCS